MELPLWFTRNRILLFDDEYGNRHLYLFTAIAIAATIAVVSHSLFNIDTLMSTIIWGVAIIATSVGIIAVPLRMFPFRSLWIFVKHYSFDTDEDVYGESWRSDTECSLVYVLAWSDDHITYRVLCRTKEQAMIFKLTYL